MERTLHHAKNVCLENIHFKRNSIWLLTITAFKIKIFITVQCYTLLNTIKAVNGKISQYFLQGESAVTGSAFRTKVGERTPWS